MKKSTIAFLGLALLLLTGNTTFAQRITLTLAGNGVAGFTGDNGASKLAQVSGPKDICMDAAQNIYFVDRANGRIRKISAQKGIITTIGGGGSSIVDGVPAITAAISPNYLCISAAGDIYFTDANQVKKISASGIISTVAGLMTAGYTGDGAAAVAATLNRPQGISIDAANNLYIADHNNHCIRKITASTGFISTIAGTGFPFNAGDLGPATAALLHSPVCVAVSPSGDIVFSDQNPNYPNYDNTVIRKIDHTTGIITRIAGSVSGGIGTDGVPALTAILGTTTGLCFTHTGELYCNEMSCSCRMMNLVSDTLFLVGGNFGIQSFSDDMMSPLSNMNVPYGLCVDNAGSVYVADSNNQRIRKIIQLTHTPTFTFGHGQYMDPVIGTPYVLDSMMWATDMDGSDMETWTVVTYPAHGTLAGFPATAPSEGTIRSAKPSGLSYTASTGYAGGDFFRIKVSDGVLSDIVSVYVGPNGNAGTLSVINPNAATAINIFPNPATSTLNVAWTGASASAEIVISDVTDRVFSRSVVNNTNTAQVNVSTLPAGTYVLRINGSEARKFVKE